MDTDKQPDEKMHRQGSAGSKTQEFCLGESGVHHPPSSKICSGSLTWWAKLSKPCPLGGVVLLFLFFFNKGFMT